MQFHSKSKDHDDLGRLGVGCRMVKNFGIPHWSNFYPALITVENQTFPPVEHCFCAAKASCSTQPAHVQEFQLDGSIGKTESVTGQTSGFQGGLCTRERHIACTKAWIQQRDSRVAKALAARAQQDGLFRKVLLETKQRNLHLLHFERTGAKSHWGGNINKGTGQPQGTNRFGQLLMALRDSIAREQEDQRKMQRVKDFK